MDKPFKHKQVTVGGKTRWTVTKNHIPYEPFEEFLSHTATIATGG